MRADNKHQSKKARTVGVQVEGFCKRIIGRATRISSPATEKNHSKWDGIVLWLRYEILLATRFYCVLIHWKPVAARTSSFSLTIRYIRKKSRLVLYHTSFDHTRTGENGMITMNQQAAASTRTFLIFGSELDLHLIENRSESIAVGVGRHYFMRNLLVLQRKGTARRVVGCFTDDGWLTSLRDVALPCRDTSFLSQPLVVVVISFLVYCVSVVPGKSLWALQRLVVL